MASPFRFFRKYLKPLMVLLGVLIMFAFVILDPLASFLAGGRGGNREPSRDVNAVAASWEGGSLTNAELGNLVARRQIANEFLRHVEGLGAQSAYDAGVEPPNLRVPRLLAAETPEQGVEQSVVRTKLFADAAREAGMHVTDDAVVQYLDELGRGRVTRDDMRKIVQRLQAGGWNVTINFIIDTLRDALLAHNYFASNMYAFQTVTPELRWMDWLTVNDRVVVDAAAIPVESFVADVKPPTEAELLAFFDKYKQREASPDLLGNVEIPSATPGFRIPRKIDVQYIQANFGEMVTKAEAEITDEEIAKYYDENKELFIKADTGLLDDSSETQDATETEEGATTDESGDAETGKATESTGESTEPTGEATEPTGEASPATEPDGTSDAAGPTNDTQPSAPVDSQPPADDSSDEAAPTDADQSSRDAQEIGRVFRQVAFLQETEAAGEEENTAAHEPAATGDPAATTESAVPAAEETEAPATPADPAATPATPPDAAQPADPPAATLTETPPATSLADEKPKQYQPLDEVRDVIRHDLAQRQVADKLKKQMDELLAELTGEFNLYLGQVSDAESAGGKAPPPPAALADLAPLAEKYGLSHGKTGPIGGLEFRNTPVGKSGDFETGMPLTAILFVRRDLELYQPVLTADVDGNHYIAMKTSDTPGQIPKLADVKEEAIRAWKMQKAAELALKDAESEAKKAQAEGASLADYFASNPSIEVVRVDPFSQLTRGDAPDQFGRQRFRISQPDGLVAPGPVLLRRIFDLKEGEVGAALNHDHSIAYVVRVVEHQNSQEELRTAYLAEANTWDGLPTLVGDRATMAQQAVAADISGGKGVDWKRTPDKVRQDGEDEVEE